MDDVKNYIGEDSKEGTPSFGYDPVKDIRPVEPHGFIDVRSAWTNHNVPTAVVDDPVNYNGIEDPESMLGTAKDIFEAYRMRDYINSHEAARKKQDGVSPVKGDTE